MSFQCLMIWVSIRLPFLVRPCACVFHSSSQCQTVSCSTYLTDLYLCDIRLLWPVSEDKKKKKGKSSEADKKQGAWLVAPAIYDVIDVVYVQSYSPPKVGFCTGNPPRVLSKDPVVLSAHKQLAHKYLAHK